MPAYGDQWRTGPNLSNPFEDTKPRISEYTAQEIATLQSRLDKKLGPEFISTRSGAGGQVQYLAAEKVINLANEVFGFNGWSSSIQNLQIDFVDESQSSGRISLGLSAIVRVTLKDGVFHEDIGYGSIENCKGKAAAFEKAKKEAATDALKRALRTFGNVLGNCIYDKEYRKQVSKVKIGPRRWNTENLHRHPDYTPVADKKPTLAELRAETGKESKHATTPGVQPDMSVSAEFEDEFGGNLFDEADFDHPDIDNTEASINNTTASESSSILVENHQGAHHGGHMGKVQPLSVLRQPNGVPGQHPPQHPKQPIQPKPPQTPSANTAARQDAVRNRTAPQQPNQAQQKPGPHQQSAPAHPQADLQRQGTRPNTPSVSESAAQHNQPAPANPPKPPDAGSRQPPQLAPSQVGFVSGRAAEHVQKADIQNAALPSNVPVFNPHAESPSLRRTSGIDHNRSAPIPRHQLANVLVKGGNTGHGNAPNGPPAHVGPAPPTSRSSFINPALDANRRIGMPGGVQSPLANRAAFKQPGPAASLKRGRDGMPARPPFADVSNVVSGERGTAPGGGKAAGAAMVTSDGSEAKKMRTGAA